MTLKFDGKSRKNNNKIKCPKCGNKMKADLLMKEGYIEKFAGVTQITCTGCTHIFNEK
ncbi:hypothetical protein [Clostridium tagluense]|uniref:Uncharacterized protein n=1 Tax=Clostridium tagluense TaxID=360422 RepID=A0A401ULL3_9CLOT|nr:hypothetical protein [Clostridium tagluense]GCD10421.1 hypothetical protein Ctaglu_20440 [Clostridium tagluense]